MTQEKGTGTALRLNEGKPRYDLVPAYAQEQYVRVLTKGSEKYAPRNWEKGMAWTKVIASLERHIKAIKNGQDYDEETGLLHSAHVMCNAAFLTEYYKIYPQGDDRPHGYLQNYKIGLDIDEVICDWVAPWCKKHNMPIPNHWDFSYGNSARFKIDPKELADFYLTLPPKISPMDLPFEPHCYITSRGIDIEITKKWIEQNGFPTVPVYSVGFGESKVDVAKKAGIDIFVDDCYKNFVELNNAGICTFLWDAPHNRKYNVGFKRITSLKQLIDL